MFPSAGRPSRGLFGQRLGAAPNNKLPKSTFHEVTIVPAFYWNWLEMHILIREHRGGELWRQELGPLLWGATQSSHSPRREATRRGRSRMAWGTWARSFGIVQEWVALRGWLGSATEEAATPVRPPARSRGLASSPQPTPTLVTRKEFEKVGTDASEATMKVRALAEYCTPRNQG